MGGSSTHTEGSKLAGMSIQSSALGAVIPIGWGRGRLSCNLIDYVGWQAIPHTKTTTTQSGKGFSSSSSQSETTYTYSASVMLSICEGPITGIVTVYKDAATFNAPNALLNAGLSLAVGNYTQTPWPYLTSLFPTHALAYRGLAYVYAQDYDLGTTGGVGNHSFEVDFTTQLGGGVVDADPKDILTDFLTNANYGIPGWITGLIGDWSDYSLYCRASNLLFSPVLDGQTAASDFIKTIMDMSHSDCFFSEGVLKIKSFGDTAITGNGVTWTPNLTPEFDLTEGDFPGEVMLEIVDQSDAYNQVSCEYLDRANEYSPAVVPAQDLDNILTYGPRKQDVQQWHYICDAAIARNAIQLWQQRVLYVRDKYHFDLPMDYIGLEPMDFVTLTTTVDGMKLNRQLVQIESIDEDEDGADELHVVAEGLPFTAGAALYASTSGDGFRPGLNDDPGNVQTPQLLNAPTSISATPYEAWAAVCGVNIAWGGCYVWVSFDGTNYSKIGTIMAPARYGVLSSNWIYTTDPDLLGTSVDLTISKGVLGSFSSAQADVGASLCLVDNELIAYSTAALTAPYKYNLFTYLRRGIGSTPPTSHLGPARFIRIDDAVFRFNYPAANAGQTIHVKFQSFNVYGRQVQDLATVTDYTLALSPAIALPAQVTGLALAGGGGTTWTGNALNIVCNASIRATGYVFNIYKADGVTLVRSIVTTLPNASYTAAQAATESVGAQREYKIQAYATNAGGNGPLSSMIDVTDAAPSAVASPAASGGAFDATVTCTASTAAGLAGYAVFYSATSGFDPATVGNVVRSGTNTVTIGGLAAGTYYCKIAAYDGWTSDPRQLNLSAQLSFVISTGGGSTPTGGGGGGTGGGGLGGGGFSGGRVQNV